jgi:hypothetical protein
VSQGRLEDVLDPEVYRILDQWSRQKGFVHEFDSELTAGRSGALVVVVDRHDQNGPSRKLIMKIDEIRGDDHAAVEYARHRRAIVEGGGFSVARIARLENDPLPVGQDRWITFQRIAGNDLEAFRTARTQLSGFIGESDTGPGAAVFGQILHRVTSGVLSGWNSGPRMTRMPVADFLKLNLGERLAPGLPLHERVSTARPDGLPGGLPDPYTLLTARSPAGDRTVQAALGRCHGDLHLDNILIRTWPEPDPADFRLVDLARYEGRGPLARDPVHLLLHMVSRALHRLGPCRDALADVLIDPLSRRADEIPGWLRTAIGEVYRAGDEWIEEFSYGGEWRRQRLLSITACALMIHVRKSTRAQDRDWFLHLGASAAAAFLGGKVSGAAPLISTGAAPSPGREPESAPVEESDPEPEPAADLGQAMSERAMSEQVDGVRAERRRALVIGVGTFEDRRFRRLEATRADIRELDGVLADPDQGRFEVTVLKDPGQKEMATGIEGFFREAAPDDFLLLYFSGHGVKDAEGRFFLVAADSKTNLLGSTCVRSDDVRDWMQGSLSKKIVVILDCCYAGAFPMSAKSGTPGLDVLNSLGGRGRAVLTATTGYAESFESTGPGNRRAPSAPSVFTAQLVRGLRSGAADLDGDGHVEIVELFHFLRERVRPQIPQLKIDVESPLYIADVRRDEGGAHPRPRRRTRDRYEPRNDPITVNQPFRPPPAPPAPRRQNLKRSLAVGVLMSGLLAAVLYTAIPDGGEWSVDFGQVDCPTRGLPVVLRNTTGGMVALTVKVDGTDARTVRLAPAATSTILVHLAAGRPSQVSVTGPDGRTEESEHQANC